MSQGAYGQGFVERVVEACDRVEAGLGPDAAAESVAAALCEHLFAGVLGYDESRYTRNRAVARFRDDAGHVAATLAAVGRGGSVDAAADAAFAAAGGEPYVQYVVAASTDRLLAYERVSEEDAADDAATETHHGVTATVHTDVPLDEAIAAGRRGRLSQTLRPGQQLAVAKLTALRPDELSAAERYEEFDAPERHSVAEDDGLGTLVGTLRDCVTDVLLPAVEEAFTDVRERTDAYEDREGALESAVDSALRGPGDDTAAAPARLRLLDHRRGADGRAVSDLRAVYGTWVRGAGRTGFTPSENERAFVRVAAFSLLEEAFLVRVAEGMSLREETLSGDAVERFEAFAEEFGVERDAGDLLLVARESFSELYDRQAPPLCDWALDHEAVVEALSRVVWYLDHFAFDVDGGRAAAAYDRLLSVLDLPEIEADATDPLPDVALDRTAFPAEPGALLDPAVGDGRYLVAAAARLRASESEESDPRERLRTVRERLVGATADPLACRVTETRLLLRLLDDYREARWEEAGFTLEPLRLHLTDPLVRPDAQTTLGAPGEARAADPLDSEAFAYVVGAFPARLRRDVAEGPAAEAYAEYDTAYYTYDTSALYVDRAADWLAENGTLSAVVSGRFRDTRFGEKLRERLPQWYRLEEVREVPGTAAGRTPVLLTARRFRKNEPLVSAAEYEPPTYSFEYAEGLDADSVDVPASLLGSDEWALDAAPTVDVDAEAEGNTAD
ncbi:hypothetical protein [Halorarum halobium]|uniref:hypothetical protein n=1 Tax=Halorarum halobium TaxID=3075121 RepID=UPI0028A7E26A|nr:hypothetical protein [Halobaculum sp. XH14]